MKMWFEATHHHNHHHHQHYADIGNTHHHHKTPSIGCISNWGAHGLLKRGLRRWGSTGSWVCMMCIINGFYLKNIFH